MCVCVCVCMCVYHHMVFFISAMLSARGRAYLHETEADNSADMKNPM